MAKLPDCDRCRYCARDYHIVCAIHPNGIEGDSCPDFSLAPERESKRYESFSGLLAEAEANEEPGEYLYQKEGAMFVNGELMIDRFGSFYNGEEIVQPHQHWSREEMLELLDEHPIFTGKCPQCGAAIEINYSVKRVHFDCDYCDWLDDSV